MLPYAGWYRRVLLPVAHKVAYEGPLRPHLVSYKGAADQVAFRRACGGPLQPLALRPGL